jgi:hypothetical protein
MTAVPSAYFDQLLTALDDPPMAIESLALVASRELRLALR